jgi:hypothetical protein
MVNNAINRSEGKVKNILRYVVRQGPFYMFVKENIRKSILKRNRKAKK